MLYSEMFWKEYLLHNFFFYNTFTEYNSCTAETAAKIPQIPAVISTPAKSTMKGKRKSTAPAVLFSRSAENPNTPDFLYRRISVAVFTAKIPPMTAQTHSGKEKYDRKIISEIRKNTASAHPSKAAPNRLSACRRRARNPSAASVMPQRI